MQLYGIKEGTPYAQWPDEALKRLGEDLGRNGPLSPEQAQIKEEVDAIQAERQTSGVSYSPDGVMAHRA